MFVKNRKTAGTTVERLLGPLAGDDAIVTPLLPAPEGMDDPMGRNWHGLWNPLPEMRQHWDRTGRGLRLRRRGIFAPLVRLRRRQPYWEHMSLDLIRRRAGARIEGYFTFCIERNPWDKVMSTWLWANRDRPACDLSEFERWVLDPTTKGLESDWPMYTIDGEIAVDFVGRFEHLREDLEQVFDVVGLERGHLQLPHEKRTERPKRTPISRAASDHIATLFAREIEAFGYREPEEFRP